MRCGLLAGSLSSVAGLVLTACVAQPGASVPMPESAVVLPADARALRYGATAPELFNNPELRDKLQALFGADWNAGPAWPYGAPAFFPPSASIRMVRIADRDYIAIGGCVPTACTRYPGLLLIGPDAQLLARLDDGGFSRYYEYGAAATGGAQARSALDGAWVAIQNVGRG
jgi:hypothetical protein